ncbi:hypothetical protein HGG73_10940 [Rhodobacteraceae bacterium R_SAG3]|nr:hypothetical protein [Rhodobacteraceae bacterium R_SAG3]
MSLTAATIEELAPDQASLKAAGKLLKPAKWPLRATNGDYIWGECQGSGANPYRVIFDLWGRCFKCTCPSPKFPCKHTLALTLMYAATTDDFTPGQLPDWGADWIGRRRKPTAGSGAPNESAPKPAKNLAAALADTPPKTVDPKKAIATEAARKTRPPAKTTTLLHPSQFWSPHRTTTRSPSWGNFWAMRTVRVSGTISLKPRAERTPLTP